MNSPCVACTSSGCCTSTLPSSATSQRPPCPRLETRLPSTGNALSERLGDLSELRGRAALTLAEMEHYERPPDHWPAVERMAFDRFVNRMKLSDCARKYRTKLRTVESRLVRLSAKFAVTLAEGVRPQKEGTRNGRRNDKTT
jgi:hypothetical protein